MGVQRLAHVSWSHDHLAVTWGWEDAVAMGHRASRRARGNCHGSWVLALARQSRARAGGDIGGDAVVLGGWVLPPCRKPAPTGPWPELAYGVLLVVMTSHSGSRMRLAIKQEFGTTDAHQYTPMGRGLPLRRGLPGAVVRYLP